MIDRSSLTDLHRHLDGNIRPQTILELGRQHNVQLPADELEALRPMCRSSRTSRVWLPS